MAHAEICPVCRGTGKYKDYMDCNYTATVYIEKICHGCNGSGWVTVGYDDNSIYKGVYDNGT